MVVSVAAVVASDAEAVVNGAEFGVASAVPRDSSTHCTPHAC